MRSSAIDLVHAHQPAAAESLGPHDKLKQAAERNRHTDPNAGPLAVADSPQAMDTDPDSPTGATPPNAFDTTRAAAAAAAPAGSSDAADDVSIPISTSSDQDHAAHISKKVRIYDPSSTNVILRKIGADADQPSRLDARAAPAVSSLRYQVTAEGSVTLPPAGAAMNDADDPQEDDVVGMQLGDGEYDDDVAAVAGDILGVGPTWGTVAGDPTSNLGGLGLGKNLDNSLADAGDGLAVPVVTPGAGPAGGTKGGTSGDTGSRVGPGVTRGGTTSDTAAAGVFSDGDADVRGRKVKTGVTEDADLPLRGVAAGAAGVGGGEEGPLVGGMNVDVIANNNNDDEYPEGFDGLDPGAIAEGEFNPSGPYVRHRSAGQTGVDPDPRDRKDPDPSKGLRDLGSLQGSGDVVVQQDVQEELNVGHGGATGSSHPVEKGDFAMGTAAVPSLADGDSGNVRGLEYTDEPKYAPEAEVGGLEGSDVGAGGGGGRTAAENGVRGGQLGAAAAATVGGVSGDTDAVEGSGPRLLQDVGTEGVQQQGIVAATSGQPSVAGSDRKHLDAIFGS